MPRARMIRRYSECKQNEPKRIPTLKRETFTTSRLLDFRIRERTHRADWT